MRKKWIAVMLSLIMALYCVCSNSRRSGNCKGGG